MDRGKLYDPFNETENALDNSTSSHNTNPRSINFCLPKSICKRTSTLNIMLHGETLSKPRTSALPISVQHCSVGQSHTVKNSYRLEHK